MSRTVNDNFLVGDRGDPITKVVVRRLPPNFTLDVFLDHVSPLPKCNCLYFVGAGSRKGPNAFSRAYINFERYDDVLKFKEKFDNYTFLGPNGAEYPAVVELAPFQYVCKDGTSNKKKDAKAGTIQFDGYYKKFLDRIRCKREGEVQRPEFCFQPKTDVKETHVTTPLLKYIKERKKTPGHDKLCSARNFSRGRCHENFIVFVNSAAKKNHRGRHVRNDGRKLLTFV